MIRLTNFVARNSTTYVMAYQTVDAVTPLIACVIPNLPVCPLYIKKKQDQKDFGKIFKTTMTN